MNTFIFFTLLLFVSNFFFCFLTKGEKKEKIESIIQTILFIFLFYIWRNSFTITSFFLLYFVNNILLVLFHYKFVKKTFSINIKYLMIVFFLFNLSILLELTLFNFRSYTTLFYKETFIPVDSIKTNLKKVSNHVYKADTGKRPYIEINNINKKIHNVYFDIVNSSESYQIIPFYTDAGNKLYQQVDSRFVSNKINASKTLHFSTCGKSEKMRFEFVLGEDETLTIHSIILNYHVPIEVNSIRVLLVFAIFCFVYFLRPKSDFYTISFASFKGKRFVLAFLFALIFFSYSAMSIRSILSFNNNDINIHNRLADSLMEGKTYFTDLNHSEELLKTMENPYDYNLREKIFKEQNRKYLWDCAYYKGKYYSYFGVVPILLFYIPFKLIFHLYLQSDFLCYVLSVFTAIFFVFLLYQIVCKYFRKCSLGLFFLLSFALIYCTGILYVLKMPTLYAVPIISGLLFTALGLNFLVSCLKGKANKIKIFLGGLSLALVAGCRPQLLLGSFLVIPIFYLYLREKPNRKEIISNIITLAIPYFLVAICLMYYNYIRFSSVFDFGANYNLTTNDMTSRGFQLSRIPLGFCFYFLNPVNIKNIFPYIVDIGLSTNYLGTTIYEPMYGGVFFSVLFTSLNLFIFHLRKKMNNKFVFRVSLLCIISAFVIAIADTEMAGILARYITDFSFFLVFSSILISLSLYENRSVKKNVLLPVLFVLLSTSLIYQFFYYFVSTNDVFRTNNLRIWYEFYYLIQFWL